jgi:hypothetical protein
MPQFVGRLAQAVPQLVGKGAEVRPQAGELLQDLRGWQVRAARADSAAWLLRRRPAHWDRVGHASTLVRADRVTVFRHA